MWKLFTDGEDLFSSETSIWVPVQLKRPTEFKETFLPLPIPRQIPSVLELLLWAVSKFNFSFSPAFFSSYILQNELAILEFIHLLVETMDRHFGNVVSF